MGKFQKIIKIFGSDPELQKQIPWDIVSQDTRIELSFIYSNRNIPWNYKSISSRPDLNIIYVYNSYSETLDWEAISGNPGIRNQDIRNNPQYPWTWIGISKNPNLSRKFILENKDSLYWIPVSVFSRKILMLLKHPEVRDRINWKYIARNKFLTEKMIIKHRKKFEDDKLEIYCNGNISLGFMIRSGLRWDPKSISSHPDIEINFIRNNFDKDIFWDWLELSKRIPISDILEYPQFPWDWFGLSQNPNLDFKFILKTLDPDFKGLGLGYCTKNKLPAWDWDLLTVHPKIQIEDIISHPELPWNFNAIGFNPNLSINHIRKYNLENIFRVSFI